ncbi:hypothetical protein P8452_53057 [Trifolium repens]|nr:hypothetical protein P8452_53057 [Trifolium repens]
MVSREEGTIPNPPSKNNLSAVEEPPPLNNLSARLSLSLSSVEEPQSLRHFRSFSRFLETSLVDLVQNIQKRIKMTSMLCRTRPKNISIGCRCHLDI